MRTSVSYGSPERARFVVLFFLRDVSEEVCVRLRGQARAVQLPEESRAPRAVDALRVPGAEPQLRECVRVRATLQPRQLHQQGPVRRRVRGPAEAERGSGADGHRAGERAGVCVEMWRRLAGKRPRIEEEETHQPSASSDPSERKYVVFESCLLELFQTCPVCVCVCVVRRRRRGGFVSIRQICGRCGFSKAWQSQPVRGSSALGDLQLSAAIHFTGGSFTQMHRVSKAMNLQTHGQASFLRHVRVFLDPAVQLKWKRDQQTELQTLRTRAGLTLSGDMQAHNTGGSAKYGSYTLMHLGSNRVLDVQLVQSSGVGGRAHMEKEGFRRALDLLESNRINVNYMVTNRHTHLHQDLGQRRVKHYYAFWHLQKELLKKLEKLSRHKDCQVLLKWLLSVKNHMFWSCVSSQDGPERVAKWKSLVNHMQNMHTHDDPMFPTCAHPHRVSRRPGKWLKPGSRVLYKLEKLLLNQRVLRDVGKLSHQHHTSALEAFHRVVRRFAPNNLALPFIGRLCRLYLAAMHFNENANPEPVTSEGMMSPKPEPVTSEGMMSPNPEPVTSEGMMSPNPEHVTSEGMMSPNPEPVTSEGVMSSNLEPMTSEGMMSPNSEPVTSEGMMSPKPEPFTSEGMMSPNPEPVTSEGMMSPNPEPVTSEGMMSPNPEHVTFEGGMCPNPEPVTFEGGMCPNPEPVTFEGGMCPNPEPVTFEGMMSPNPEPVTFEGMMSPNPERRRPKATPGKAEPTFGYVRDLMRLLFMEVLGGPEELPEEVSQRSTGGQCQTCE
ncbi:uncharacterized protein [Pseudorasbora parva]|uniref:uncharacterized protein isoform X2 n=1 Tax=Pseudorasbora parva TaxID=51549 RepID=UPI00351F28A7